uniref:TGF_BETA_2 domain-containing protein n=1 Tax=Strongyloides stercoralis TaxID=6248 RepID=A0A0K0E686_STRER
MLMKCFYFFLLFTSTTTIYINPSDKNEYNIISLSDVIQKHLNLKAGENIKPGLPYQTINIFSELLSTNYDKNNEKKSLDNNIINWELNKNSKQELINNQDSFNSYQNTLSDNFIVYQSTRPKKISRRSISNAVIESAHCEHMELIECDSYETNDMKCLVTATGMPCCVCTGKLKSLRKVKKWIVW